MPVPLPAPSPWGIALKCTPCLQIVEVHAAAEELPSLPLSCKDIVLDVAWGVCAASGLVQRTWCKGREMPLAGEQEPPWPWMQQPCLES